MRGDTVWSFMFLPKALWPRHLWRMYMTSRVMVADRLMGNAVILQFPNLPTNGYSICIVTSLLLWVIKIPIMKKKKENKQKYKAQRNIKWPMASSWTTHLFWTTSDSAPLGLEQIRTLGRDKYIRPCRDQKSLSLFGRKEYSTNNWTPSPWAILSQTEFHELWKSLVWSECINDITPVIISICTIKPCVSEA